MRYGTSYFVSFELAVSYYKAYGFSRQDVGSKRARGEIHIGEPRLRPGQRLVVIDEGTRYAIEEDE